MKRLLMLLPILLAACGGGAENAPVTKPAPQSRLVSFDARGLDAGLELPDFTEYWTLAEARNGNSFPIKTSLDDEVVMAVRLNRDGLALFDREFVPASLAAVVYAAETHTRRFWIEKLNTGPGAVVLFCDGRTPYTELLKLCRGLIQLQLSNLWLVTRDQRDDALRLLPLYMDKLQLTREWYYLEEHERAATARLAPIPEGGLRFTHLAGDAAKDLPPGMTPQEVLAPWLKAEKLRVDRIQFDLPEGATCAAFAETVASMAWLGVPKIEPFWQSLNVAPAGPKAKEARKLAAFTGHDDVFAGLRLPSMSEYWRACAADAGLAAPGSLTEGAAFFGWRIDDAGRNATRAPGDAEWQTHEDELAAVRHLQASAEVDFDLGLSDLPVVLAMDRDTPWVHLLGVREAMRTAACWRLYVVVHDVIGPTARLLDLSLPLNDPPPESEQAMATVDNSGGSYRVTLGLDGTERTTTGAGFAAALALWADGRKSSPRLLGVRLPRDEPFSTFFTVVNALAWLGMSEIVVGG